MSERKLKSDEILEKIMQEHDGQASLGLIYREYKKKWESKSNLRGKTPLNTLRGEVQKSPKFERVSLGVYALRDFQRPPAVEAKTKKEKQERNHSDIQGMLLEIGNHRSADTYTPDKKKMFLGQTPLGSFASMDKFPNFTYPHIVKSTRWVDVLWFNERKFPTHAFEVEHSTDFRNAMTKFCELQDFHVKFYCVSEQSRFEKFNHVLGGSAFSSIKERCEFRSYEDIEEIYNGLAVHQKIQKL